MEERDVLQHLLQIENEAAHLASDAQAEADRRVSEREKVSREAYSARYGARVAELEEEYQRKAAAAAAEYDRLLASYRAALEMKNSDGERFSALVAKLLFKAE